MRILIADKLSETTVAALSRLGAEVGIRPELAAEDLPGAIAGVNVLIVRSTRVTAETIDAAADLSLIIRAGAGVNTIDVDAASARGIYVANCPGRNSAAVAELTIGLLIACDRRIANATADLRAGKWRKKEYGDARGLKGRRLGVLGLGMIGRAVVKRALALEMRVVAWSRSLTPKIAGELGVTYAKTGIEVMNFADAVTIHLAATPQTKHLIGEKLLSEMRPGAILINTSRGDLIDTAALKTAIRENNLRVGLDVFEDEPGGGEAEFFDAELAELITATPHIGASTDQAAEAIAAETVRIVTEFRNTGKPPNTVNLCARTPATHALVVRHYNRVGVLAGVLDSLRDGGINVEEMENTIFEGAEAACCTLLLDSAPTAETLSGLQSSDDVLQVTLEARA